MSYLNEKVVINDNVTPHDPISMLRAVADNLDTFWGPVCAQFAVPAVRKYGPCDDKNYVRVLEDDVFVKGARDDAQCLRAVADLLEKNSGRS